MRGLEARYYADPGIFAAEREAIFTRAWQLFGAAAAFEQPGAYVCADLAGVSVIVIRGTDGALRGFHNVCRHRGARLLDEGAGVATTFRCPYHAWCYDTEGRLTATPWFDEPSPFDLASLPLQPIYVEMWRGLVFVAIAPDMPLLDQLGDLPGELAPAQLESFTWMASQRLRADINWKTYIDQFNEFYHVPVVHARGKAIGLERYTATPMRGMMRMMAPEGASYYGGCWYWGWPNWTLSLFPGGMKTTRINPLDAEHIDVDFQYFFADVSEAAADARARVVQATVSIFAEDVVACTRAQVNYAAGVYQPGPLHPEHEQAVAYFQERVRAALGDGQSA